MKLIVGLGNPGKEYEKTRHNIGFIILDKLLKDVDWKKENDAFLYAKKYDNQKIIFLKPQQYMNLSGLTISKYLKYYKVPVENLLIIHDDVDLDIGNYKQKINSGSGGHNGIQSVIDHLNSTAFKRIKIGVSKQENKDTSDHVLGKFTKKEMQIIENIYPEIVQKINDFIFEENI